MRHDDASYIVHMSCSILYCIVYRINVYVWMSIFLFILFAFLHVYTVCSIIVCFWYVYMLYSMYSPKGGNKEYLSIYLSIYLVILKSCPLRYSHNFTVLSWINYLVS